MKKNCSAHAAPAQNTTHAPAAPTPQPTLHEVFAPRLVTLCDGRVGLRGGLKVETQEPTATPQSPTGPSLPTDPAVTCPSSTHSCPTIDFIASDETLDRYDEILSADGWRLEAYRRNPVFQNAHQYGDILFTLGRALITEVRAGRLFQRVEFAVDANPMARIAYRLYRGKFLNAVSVGFIPLRWETGGEHAGFKRRFLEQELLEVSAVGIPANPNALQLGLKAGAIDAADLRETLELLQLLCEPAQRPAAPAAPPGHSLSSQMPPPPAPGPLPDASRTAFWLEVARQIRRVLRGS